MTMRILDAFRPLLGLLGVLALAAPAHAISVAHVNLAELTQRADKIVRGTVVDATPGVARIGGRELPVVTYRVRVAERFKGAVQSADEGQYVEVRMLAGFGPQDGTTARSAVHRHPELPALERGADYLLFVSAPSSAGLSTTIGLGQGKYRLSKVGATEYAVNDLGNRALFRGMKQAPPERAPIQYGQLRERVRELVRSGGR